MMIFSFFQGCTLRFHVKLPRCKVFSMSGKYIIIPNSHIDPFLGPMYGWFSFDCPVEPLEMISLINRIFFNEFFFFKNSRNFTYPIDIQTPLETIVGPLKTYLKHQTSVGIWIGPWLKCMYFTGFLTVYLTSFSGYPIHSWYFSEATYIWVGMHQQIPPKNQL